MSARRSEVKTVASAGGARGISRHLEGWQPGLVAVIIALIAVFLAVPRSIPPDTIPLPHVDWREAERSAARERERARAALAEPLPYEVRGVGELFRAFGASNRQHSSGVEQIHDLRTFARAARRKLGDEPLLRLQALQTELFLTALTRLEQGEDVRGELDELGGSFVDKARASGWMDGQNHLRANEHERRVLFRVRWSELTGLRSETAFAPTANEWRLYYRFLLTHPERDRALMSDHLRYVAAVEKVDLDYPGAFARGVIYFRLGAFKQSADAFKSFLEKRPSGAWRLRAKNHLLAAAERVGDGPR